jgi:hypothetical protein
VAKHNNKESCWLVAHGFVFDATKFLPHHPAGFVFGGFLFTFSGMQCILKKAGGQDCSVDLDFHREGGKQLWKAHRIGRLAKG